MDKFSNNNNSNINELITMLGRLNEIMRNDNNVPYKIVREDSQEIILSLSEIRLLSKIVNDIFTTVTSSVNYYGKKPAPAPISKINAAISYDEYTRELELR